MGINLNTAGGVEIFNEWKGHFPPRVLWTYASSFGIHINIGNDDDTYTSGIMGILLNRDEVDALVKNLIQLRKKI